MKKNTVIILILLLGTGLQMTAQQMPHYTQYMYNMNIINPAYVGMRSDISLSLLSRKQWVKLNIIRIYLFLLI